jgi:hypothetical protein
MSPSSPSPQFWLSMELRYRVAMDGGRASVRSMPTALRLLRSPLVMSCTSVTLVGSRGVLSTFSCNMKD